MLVALLMFGVGGVAPAQTGGATTESENRQDPPEPYDPEEFEPWMRDLRRAEIVTLGAFPLVLAFTALVYGPIRFLARSIEAGAVDLRYAPWFFAPPDAPQFTNDENTGIILTAVGLSIVVGVIDLVLGLQDSAEAED